jgi:putative ABC transport system substrate-binding protein
MNRRAFIGSLALATLAAARVARAQPARKVYRIGVLSVLATADLAGPEPRSPFGTALLRGLAERGYVYGQDFVTEHRGAEGKPERYPVLASELARLKPDVIVAAGPALSALKQATATIPIVMAAAIDPIAEGLVHSLGHPGTNFTGLSHQFPETTGKRLELLKELVPGAATVAVLWDRGAVLSWQAADAAARARRWKLLSLEIRDAAEIEGAFRAATNARAGALLVLTGQIAFPHRKRIAELADRSRLPAMYDLRPYVEAGGLISHGADLLEIWHQAAGFVDKILKGAKPGDLPVEQPTKFELVVNMKTAKALGITIPQSVLLQADEVIK